MTSLTKIKSAIRRKSSSTTVRRRLPRRRLERKQLPRQRKRKVHLKRPPKRRPRPPLAKRALSRPPSRQARMQRVKKKAKVKKKPRKLIVVDQNLPKRPLEPSQPNLLEKKRNLQHPRKLQLPSVKRPQRLLLQFLQLPSQSQVKHQANPMHKALYQVHNLMM